jgi:transcriptional regulator with XRE-family HTH domain
MTQPEVMSRAGATLKQMRVRLGFSLREVERRSLALVESHQNPDYSLSKAWITDVEKGRFVPGSTRMSSLSEIYGMDLSEIQKLYGIGPSEFTKERLLFRPPKTHLLTFPEEFRAGGESTEDYAEIEVRKTNLLSRLVDIWGDVPVPLIRRLDLRRCLYGFIGMEDKTMSPLLPPGTFVQIDPKQTRIQKGPFKPLLVVSDYGRPIYFLDIRTGYACCWCELKDTVLTLIPHHLSGEQTRSFRYPNEVSVVGLVTGIARRIGEEGFSRVVEPPKGPIVPNK